MIVLVLSIVILISIFTLSINAPSISSNLSKQFFGKGIYGEKTFWEDSIRALNQSIFEIIIFTIVLGCILGYFKRKQGRLDELETYMKNLSLAKNLDGADVNIHKSMWLAGIFDLGGSEIELKNMKFKGINIAHYEVEKINFSGTNFNDSKLNNITFTNCDFSGASFNNSKLEKIKFLNCKMERVYQKNITGVGIDFTGCDLTQGHFDNSQLRSSNFKSTNINGVIFKKANLAHANFTNIDENNLDLLEIADNLNRIKINKEFYANLKEKFPEKFKRN